METRIVKCFLYCSDRAANDVTVPVHSLLLGRVKPIRTNASESADLGGVYDETSAAGESGEKVVFASGRGEDEVSGQ